MLATLRASAPHTADAHRFEPLRKAMSARFSPTAWVAAPTLLALSIMSAPARSEPIEGMRTWNCYGTRGMESCVSTFRKGRFHPHVISVPAPLSPNEVAAAEARDRRWAERCQPVIRQDRYGMPRYSYGAPGCEFGRLD
jgi:hypothetical protein